MELSRASLKRSTVLDAETGGDQVHGDRTSAGTHFARGGNALVSRIEARIARLLDWPVENGEALQILRSGVGAQYKPQHDYFDPYWSGPARPHKHGRQRVASLLRYQTHPERGGANPFPAGTLRVGA